jgi:imidazolonepropionase-like amidohydrolase
MTAWRIQATLLPDGDVAEAGITEGGQWTSRPAPGAETLPGRFVLPGLVDAHCHLGVGQAEGGPIALDPAAVRANLKHAHSAGITAIRDTGSPGSVTLQILAAGEGAGLQACGRFLAPEGRYFPSLHMPVPPEDLITAALAEVRAGAAWIKLIADFPFLSPDQPSPDPLPTYPVADIQRLAEAVHAAGARVAAHSTTRYVTELIAAGIDSVEHGTALDEAGIKSLSYLLPRAADSGLTIMTGTDIVGSIPREVALLAELGLPPQQALAAASTAARQFLGFTGLDEGEPADLVTYSSDPRDDPAVLGHPDAIFLRGTRIK